MPALFPFYLTPAALRDGTSTDPTLDVMVARAIDRLSMDPDGFFLFVENETPDTLGHLAAFDATTATTAMPAEILQLDDAVGVAIDWVAAESSFTDTMLIVTSDHECGGYTFENDDPSMASFPGSPNHTFEPVPLYAAGVDAALRTSVCVGAELFSVMTGQLAP